MKLVQRIFRFSNVGDVTDPVIKAEVSERAERVRQRSEETYDVLRSEVESNHFAERWRYALRGA